jgi:hypothetical protein
MDALYSTDVSIGEDVRREIRGRPDQEPVTGFRARGRY